LELGNTWRWPLAETVPIPWSIETSVAFCTFQRSVADWPRWMEEGSTENEIEGFGGGGAGCSGGGGGGGGGTGALFLHPAANNAIVKAKRIQKSFR
jgi:hypothetical protein